MHVMTTYLKQIPWMMIVLWICSFASLLLFAVWGVVGFIAIP